jgi:hypothetical protein
LFLHSSEHLFIYNALSNNCQHFARNCCVGHRGSIDAHYTKRLVVHGVSLVPLGAAEGAAVFASLASEGAVIAAPIMSVGPLLALSAATPAAASTLTASSVVAITAVGAGATVSAAVVVPIIAHAICVPVLTVSIYVFGRTIYYKFIKKHTVPECPRKRMRTIGY